jgi:hypothetical protein
MSEQPRDRSQLNGLSSSESVEVVCDEFEGQWIALRQPRIGDYLDRVSTQQRAAIARQLIRIEVDYRRRKGENPRLEEYETRLPGCSSVLIEFFDNETDSRSGDVAVTQDLAETSGRDAATVPAENASEAPSLDATQDGVGSWVHEIPVAAREEPSESGSAQDGDLPRVFAGGRYQVIKKLGGGGQKTALLARDVELDRDVVIAVLRLDVSDGASLTRIRSEARATARLDDHPNIVSIHDIGEQNGQPYFVSQYIEGGSVADLLRERGGTPIPIEEVARIGEQVCQALEYAHQNNIVHRDVKPDNVWLTPDGTVKLGDFGLAAPLDRSRMTGTGVPVGTAAYMPPEQALGTDVGPQSDLYSLGIMLYEMVTGGYPFQGDSFVGVISQHLNTAPVPPCWHNSQVGQSLNSLILRLLAKVMEDRPRTAAAVREVLLSFAEAIEASVSEPGHQRRSVEQLAAGVFVGRHTEMQELRAGLDDAVVGRGQILLLTGEPGSGKTRTAEEVRTYARVRNMEVLSGRCFEGEGAPAFWPWVQIIHAYSRLYEWEKRGGTARGDGARGNRHLTARFRDPPAASRVSANARDGAGTGSVPPL